MSQLPWLSYPPTRKNVAQRATVIGAGLAGTSVAVALAKRGWEITLIERHHAPAMEASGNPSGVVMPTLSRDNNAISQFSQRAFNYAKNYFQQLENTTNTSFFHPMGVMRFTEQADQFSSVIGLSGTPPLHWNVLNTQQVMDISGICIDAPQSRACALHFPDAGWVKPVALCQAQIAWQRQRITALYNCQVLKLVGNRAGWSVVGEHGELSKTPVVILANGTTANQFALSRSIDLVSIRGQISYVARSALAAPVKTVLCSQRGYVIPDQPTSLSVGASYERGVPHTRVTTKAHRENLQRLQSLCAVASESENTVAGGRAAIRASTADRLPLVGGVPDFLDYKNAYGDLHHGRPVKNYSLPFYCQGLFIAAGFGSHGITCCPYSGELLARLIHGDIQDYERKLLALLHPGRFLARKLRKNQGPLR